MRDNTKKTGMWARASVQGCSGLGLGLFRARASSGLGLVI